MKKAKFQHVDSNLLISGLQNTSGSWVHAREEIAGLLTSNFKEISTSVSHSTDEKHYDILPQFVNSEDNEALLRIPSK